MYYVCHMIKIKPHSFWTCLLSHGNSALRPRAVLQQTRPQLMWFYYYNYKVMKTPVNKTDRSNWKDFIPHRSSVLLEDLEIFNECNVTHGKILNLLNDYQTIKS